MATRDRQEVLGLWRRVAEGKTDDAALRAWLAGVAREILAADETKDANKRRTGVLKAVGLEGRRGTAEAYAVAALAEGWPDRSEDGLKNLRVAQAYVLGHPIGSAKELDPEVLRGRVRSATEKTKPKK